MSGQLFAWVWGPVCTCPFGDSQFFFNYYYEMIIIIIIIIIIFIIIIITIIITIIIYLFYNSFLIIDYLPPKGVKTMKQADTTIFVVPLVFVYSE